MDRLLAAFDHSGGSFNHQRFQDNFTVRSHLKNKAMIIKKQNIGSVFTTQSVAKQ